MTRLDHEIPDSKPRELWFDDVHYTVPTEDGPKEILKGVHGIARPGRMTALMGPSGCGKTTLLNIISTAYRRTNRISGTYGWGDTLIGPWFKERSCYTEQQEYLCATDTIRQAVSFAADLNLDHSIYPKETRERIVDKLIDEVNLTTVKNSLIGDKVADGKGISGGERKRTSLCIQLTTLAPCLLLDEYTSGLDSSTAYNVTKLLRDIVYGSYDNVHRTCLMALHSPCKQLYDLFDDVIIMCEGRTIYVGPRDQVGHYYTRLGFKPPDNYNIADYILDVFSRDAYMKFDEDADTRIDKALIASERQWSSIAESIPSEQSHLKVFPKPKTSNLNQFKCLSSRMLRTARYNPAVSLIVGIQLIGMAILVALLWLQFGSVTKSNQVPDIFGQLFFCFMVFSFAPAIICLVQIHDERELFFKETRDKMYYTFPYLLSFYLIKLVLYTIFVIIAVSIYYWITYVRIDSASAYFIHMFTIVFNVWVSLGIGTFFGACIRDLSAAIGITIIVLIVFNTLIGFLNTDVPGWFLWIQIINPWYYAFQEIMYIEFKNRTFEPSPGGVFTSGQEVLDYFNVINTSLVANWFIVLGWAFGMFFLCYIALFRRFSTNK